MRWTLVLILPVNWIQNESGSSCCKMDGARRSEGKTEGLMDAAIKRANNHTIRVK